MKRPKISQTLFAATSSGGIARIHFRDFVEVDHLTYGYAIPEPSTLWLAAASGWLCLRRRRLRAV